MSEWQQTTLGKVLTLQRGYDLPSHQRVSGKYPIVSSSGITDYHNQYKVDPPGVITGRYGTIGEVYYIDERFWPLNTTLFVKDFKGNDVRFISYLLESLNIKELNVAGAVPGVNRNHLHMLKVSLPRLPTQQKIAKILSNYDDLIENNLKRIKLLEESARLTYEEWFLRFRVDGKKLEIDPESSLPFEWKRLKVNDYVDTISKGPSLNYDLGESKGVQVLNQSCIRNGEIELDKVLIAKELNDNKKSSYLRINDILINSMGQGTLGRVSKNVSIDEKMIIHNCITYLRAKDIYSQYMLFYFISSHKEYFESLAQGSTGQSTLKKELVSNLLITLPDDKTINRYDLIISSAWNKIGALKKQNKLLKEARDILLPRLMTGMIDTDDMDIAV